MFIEKILIFDVLFIYGISGMHLGCAIGQMAQKITTGALFGKQCARHGALFFLRAHFLKMGAPDFSHVFYIFWKYCFPFTLLTCFFVYKVHSAGWPASEKIREFHNQFSNPGKSENLALFGENRGHTRSFPYG